MRSDTPHSLAAGPAPRSAGAVHLTSPTPRAARILGTGHHVPDVVVSNRDLETRMNTSDAFIRERTGVRERRHAPPGVTLGDLIAPAVDDALAMAGLVPAEIDLLIVNSLSPDFHDPSQACLMQARLGLRPVPAFDIRAQCSGGVYAMDVASQFIASGRCRHVLVVCAELLSRRFDTSDAGRNLAVLLGDGAGAVVLGPAEAGDHDRFLTIETGSDGRWFDLLMTAAPGSAGPQFITAADLAAGRHQFRMRGRDMAAHAAETLTACARGILERSGVALEQVDLVLAHQPNLRLLEDVRDRLGIRPERLPITVDRLGNMASASLMVTTDLARRAGRMAPGNLVLFLAYGAGATWGAALYRC